MDHSLEENDETMKEKTARITKEVHELLATLASLETEEERRKYAKQIIDEAHQQLFKRKNETDEEFKIRVEKIVVDAKLQSQIFNNIISKKYASITLQ